MMTRRELLRAGLLLPVLPGLLVENAIAQDAQKSSHAAPFPDFPGVTPQFIPRCSFFRTQSERDQGRALEFGIKPQEFFVLRDTICTRMYQDAVPHHPGKGVADLANRIRKDVEGVFQAQGVEPNNLLRQWMYAEAVCAWVMVQVRYNTQMAQGDPQEIMRTQQAEQILALSEPNHVCSGKAFTVREVSNAIGQEIGLRCYRVGGWIRNMGQVTPKDSNHAWNCFEFENKVRVPADAALAVSKEWARGRDTKINKAWVLPCFREAWEFFLAGHFGYINTPGKENILSEAYYPKNGIDHLMQVTFSEWFASSTDKYKQMETVLRDDAQWPDSKRS